jgi:alkane 1-monooxygenase
MKTITATVDDRTVTWKDSKRYLWLLGLVVPLLPYAAWREVDRFGLDIFWWLGPIWVLVLIPVLDALFGEDRSNPPEWAVEPLASDRFYRWCT